MVTRCWLCILLSLISLSFSGLVYAGSERIDTFSLSGRQLYAYCINRESANRDLLIFLHGSVKAYTSAIDAGLPAVSELLEGNQALLPVCAEAGVTVVIPVVSGFYNWLEPQGALWLDALLNRYSGQFDRIFISGFSDGGTGAYRYFYSNPTRFSGLWILNGYPQLHNFHRKVQYHSNTDRPVVIYSQIEDKIVPYEFLLTEFRRQKMLNGSTIFRLFPGKHELAVYDRSSFSDALDHLRATIVPRASTSDSLTVFPPLDAWMTDSTVRIQYTFRSKIGKAYGMRSSEWKQAALPFHPEKVKLILLPLRLPVSRKSEPELEFQGFADGKMFHYRCTNYLSQPAW